VAVLRDLVGVAESQYKADILIFTDANTRFQRDALKRLLIPMQDATVGGVCGRLVLDDSSEQPVTHEPLYWRWEARLKQMESRLDSCLGANGAIYALRCGLFWKDVPPNTIVDDFVLGMKVREAGYRMIFAPDAVAEEALPDVADEWRRRVRIGAGDFQALGLCRACLSPRYGRFAWMFWSHKVLRWLTPPMGLLAVAAAALLSVWGRSLVPPIADARLFLADSVVLVVLAALLAAGLGALLRRFSRDRRRWARPFVAWHYFMLMQLALLVGFVRFCRGNLQGSWDRTARRSRERMHDSGR